MYCASYFGLSGVIKALPKQEIYVNTQNEELRYSNCLSAASGNGHEEVVKLLLAEGADINAQAGDNGSALYHACDRYRDQDRDQNRKVITQLLLDQGADINAQGGRYGNAL